MSFQLFHGIITGSYCHRFTAENTTTFNVTRCVPDDKNLLGRELLPMALQGSGTGKLAQLIAVVGIVREGSELEIIPHSVMAQFDLCSACNVASQKSKDASFVLLEFFQKLDDARQEPSLVQGHALFEIVQVGIQESRNVLRCDRKIRLLEHLARNQAIRGSREIDSPQVLRNAKGIPHGVLEGLLSGSP